MPDSSYKDLLKENLDFAIEKMHYHKNINMSNTHYHSHYELLYISSGTRTLKINNALTYTLNSHNIALLRPNIVHQTLSSETPNQTRILINISEKLLNELTNNFSENIVSCFNTPVISFDNYHSGILNYLFTELLDSKDSLLYDETVKINLSKILLLLSKLYHNSTFDDDTLFANSNARVLVDYSAKFIQENYASNITIADLAEKLFISETYLERIFKKIMGTTPYNYLLSIRMINAKRLLQSRRMSVSDIATACGFNSLMAFSRAFKKIQNCSPKEYQKINAAEN